MDLFLFVFFFISMFPHYELVLDSCSLLPPSSSDKSDIPPDGLNVQREVEIHRRERISSGPPLVVALSMLIKPAPSESSPNPSIAVISGIPPPSEGETGDINTGNAGTASGLSVASSASANSSSTAPPTPKIEKIERTREGENGKEG